MQESQNKICVFCGEEIKESSPHNFLLDSYSHKDCDENKFKDIDKKAKYF